MQNKTKAESKKNSRALVSIGMDDVPWLDKEAIEQVVASTPLHLRDAVRNGTPSIGSGAIYPISLDEVVLTQDQAQKLKPFPPHWKGMYGMDVGWNRTAIVFLIHDTDTDTMYVTDEYYGTKAEPEIHAARIKVKAGWMNGVIDPAAKGRSQVDGDQLIRIYRQLGLKVREANNAVESGIYSVWSRLSTGRLKFFPNTPSLQSEYVIYRRDEDGRIIKEHDHALDALRYAINTWQFATPRPVDKPLVNTIRKYNV